MMAERGIEVHVLPATATLDDVLAVAPDGLFFSNGPGDPAATTGQVELLRARWSAGLPYFGICFGNQLFGRALGLRHLQAEVRPPRHQPAGDGPHHRQGRGHRAQPRLRGRRAPRRADHATPYGDGHGQPRLPQRRRGRGPRAARRRTARCTAFSVQYHPEAAAGPHDAAYLFDRFVELMAGSGLMPKRDRHRQRPGDRLRADRHRPGLRVRLLRHPGLPGAARPRACG